MSRRHTILGFGAAALIATGALWSSSHSRAEAAMRLPAPAVDEPPQAESETAVVAGGCFWGVQGVFQHVKGVTQALSGYSGGSAANAHYGLVGTGETGHAESVQITFDPRVVSYGQILQIYFSVVTDPTELNRQGPDVGSQYRSVVFAADNEQRKVATAYIAQLDKAHVFDAKIATRVDPLKGFYPAEGYHQDFAALHPDNGYIAENDLPKIDNLRRLFPALYQTQPKLVGAGE
ncbi:MAG: peptide-methionine (S)-S-oxide reductase MsrA [Methylovirgula sp.]